MEKKENKMKKLWKKKKIMKENVINKKNEHFSQGQVIITKLPKILQTQLKIIINNW